MKRRISTLDLAAYSEGRLTAADRERVEEALAGDEAAMDELLSLHRAVAGMKPAERAPSRLVSEAIALYPGKARGFDLVIGLAGDVLRVLRQHSGIELSLHAATVAVRGGSGGTPLLKIRKQCGNVATWLYIEGTGPSTCTIRVRIAPDSEGDGSRLRAEVLRDERVVASEGLGSCQAVFETIGTGDYAIRFRRGNAVLGDVTIRIKGLRGGNDD